MLCIRIHCRHQFSNKIVNFEFPFCNSLSSQNAGLWVGNTDPFADRGLKKRYQWGLAVYYCVLCVLCTVCCVYLGSKILEEFCLLCADPRPPSRPPSPSVQDFILFCVAANWKMKKGWLGLSSKCLSNQYERETRDIKSPNYLISKVVKGIIFIDHDEDHSP